MPRVPLGQFNRISLSLFFFQAEDGIRDHCVTGVQTCALPISPWSPGAAGRGPGPCSRKERLGGSSDQGDLRYQHVPGRVRDRLQRQARRTHGRRRPTTPRLGLRRRRAHPRAQRICGSEWWSSRVRAGEGLTERRSPLMANDDTNNAQAHQQTPDPNPDLENLETLVGTWEMSGDVRGTVTYEWMEGGFFLIQRVDLEQYGQRIKGIEIIGHERPFGADPGEEIKSRFYSNTGDTLDYVYELQGDTLTIWGGERGSPAY